MYIGKTRCSVIAEQLSSSASTGASELCASGCITVIQRVCCHGLVWSMAFNMTFTCEPIDNGCPQHMSFVGGCGLRRVFLTAKFSAPIV